jgi:hypothetical protein
MDSTRIHPPTRELRGLQLYRDRGKEVVRVYPGVYSVPSCSGETFYTVHLSPRERCDCPDYERHHKPCKHLYAAVVAAAKARARARARA